MAIGQEKSIFLEALDIDSPEDRDAYLRRACQGDPQLLASVSDLLREHSCTDNLVDQPIATVPRSGPDQTDMAPGQPIRGANHFPGTMVGPYKLMEQIGEGGFGLVFVADQQHPVRRRVALKVIKPGMESREVIARFEAERQALALMDHPNIARVFDAGVADSGQPYFVMELVRGVPLNQFCDNHKLDTRERLHLFMTLCHALQHAHQKGIIHRDLKPSNILVTLQDGQPLAKVIDFGVAKAIGQSLTGKTIYTRFASMIGTPAYMSPEQAEMSNVDIDTRADIYSLGVLLYELLTGSTPFGKDRLDSAGFDELRRIIREEDPPRPSTRLSTLNQELSNTVSVNRRIEPAKLTSIVKGDLDWIVMKAIDKDRNRRYPTAGALAEDVSRFLLQQPVEARPPSAGYRFSKFARRNKASITTASLVFSALVLGTVISIWQAGIAVRESRAKQVALDEKQLALNNARAAETRATIANEELELFTQRLKQANILLSSGRAHADSQRWAEAHDDYTRATETQPRYHHVWIERASLYVKLGLYDLAARDYREALDLGAPIHGPEWWGVPQLFWLSADDDAYQELCRRVVKHDDDPLSLAATRGCLAGPQGYVSPSEMAEQMEASILAAEMEAAEIKAAEIDCETDESKNSTHHANDRGSRKWGRKTMPMGVLWYAAGWAHFRAGHFEQAILRLQQSGSDDAHWMGKGIEAPLLAMAYHKSGKAAEAQTALDQSQAFLDEHLNETLGQSRLTPALPWFDWVDFLINHRHAQILITGKTPPEDPRVTEIRAQAIASIQ
ncbi:Serine/threonine-protein kinase PknB [Stieleria maiorica]|uniref:Serine/threonine-protein kinase PknB n=1 Tax=Stieleria maiorica TaxID=2795974 RepID=A0A5B9M9V4_9BACT|nr:serine/threonine-protein kinase [Stieleria maiorica]QEF97463.1 Serine/threonine-protein kinase PknB [Stieleria maiorica]